MEESEAWQRLQEYDRRERQLRRRFIAPIMFCFATYAFVYLWGGGFEPWVGDALGFAVLAGWMVHSWRCGVSWTAAQNRKLYIVAVVGWCWIVACHAYFVNWNPRGIPQNGLVGGILAAAPFLVLAYWYRS